VAAGVHNLLETSANSLLQGVQNLAEFQSMEEETATEYGRGNTGSPGNLDDDYQPNANDHNPRDPRPSVYVLEVGFDRP
jgi:hypothetical protein